jgi:hypothetical protein
MALPRIEQHLADYGGVDPAEAAAWADEQRSLGARGEYYFAVIQCGVTATRPD